MASKSRKAASHGVRILTRRPGLAVTYDGSGAVPGVVLSSPAGDIRIRGRLELKAAAHALAIAARYAGAFGSARRFLL